MKYRIVGLLLAVAVGSASAAELTWLTDLPKAQATAKAEQKLVFVNFTGSDWCSYCKKLDKEVFQTPEFAEYARKNLVLVELDFPNRKPQSAALKEANRKLQGQYKVEGFPTLVVLNGAGKEVGREVGYGGGGPRPLLAKLEKMK
jgi:protein disulfide-isomerase